jgi:hypothetical protein
MAQLATGSGSAFKSFPSNGGVPFRTGTVNGATTGTFTLQRPVDLFVIATLNLTNASSEVAYVNVVVVDNLGNVKAASPAQGLAAGASSVATPCTCFLVANSVPANAPGGTYTGAIYGGGPSSGDGMQQWAITVFQLT